MLRNFECCELHEDSLSFAQNGLVEFTAQRTAST